MTPLLDVLRALYRQDLETIRRFGAAETNARDGDGRTPLMHAALAEDSSPAVVALLIERGADASIHDDGERWTALHFAARDGKAAVVETLLRSGAPVDAADRFGNTPLWRCVANACADPDTVKTLLAYGADPDRGNHAGSRPRDVARRLHGMDLAQASAGGVGSTPWPARRRPPEGE